VPASRFDRASTDEVEWLLRRNCALSPRQLACGFGGAGLISLAIAFAFASQGAWLIAPFAGVELLALTLAYVVYARQTGDFDRVTLAADRLYVEVMRGRRASRFEANRNWVRVEMGKSVTASVRISERGQSVEVGRLVAFHERVEFMRDLAQNLRLDPVARAKRGVKAGMEGEVA